MNKYLFRFVALVLFLFVSGVQAQTKLQTPESFLGYPLGSQFTTHANVLRYTEYLVSQNGSRMRMQTYGHTYEGRPLTLITVSSEANINNLEDIRTSNLRRTGLLSGQPSANQPAIVWLSYNVHGNEAVSSEAVLQVLYDLANPDNKATQAWLEKTVVLLDPCVNPDGRERYVQWYKQAAAINGNPNRYAREHFEPWPSGRPNHYLFDLNRDWAWQTQKESQHRIALYNQWMPHLHADFHEMGVDNPYYFSPAAKPFHADVTPWQRQFQNIIGDNNRKYFDANNWLYFTREVYDLFYPSYGDTWPTFNGAIAMTYEQGGSGRAGLAYAKKDGDTLTLKQRIDHHHAASLASIEAVAERKDQVVSEFQKYYDRARNNPTGEYKAFVISSKNDAGKLKAFTDYLDRNQIRYGFAKKGTSIQGFDYFSGKTASVKTEENDLVVNLAQPKATLIKVLFEPRTELEDSLTYDITSWSLPYAYGLNAWAVKSKVNASDTKSGQASAAVSSVEKPYAYVAPWGSAQDLKFLTSLLKEDISVRYSELPFEIEGKTFQPGSLIITRTGNERKGEAFDQIVRKHADTLGISLLPVKTGFVTKGADFGSSNVHSIKKPKVALMAGQGVSSLAFGEVWHYFEQQIDYPVTVLETAYFSSVPLNEFDVLILPMGSYGKTFDEAGLKGLKDWVSAGGKLIAMESAAAFFAGKPGFELKKKAEDTVDVKKEPYKVLKAYGERERAAISEEIQGSVYRVTLDATHPLAFGYGDSYYALIREANNLQFMKKGWNVGILKKDNYLTGFAGAKARKKMEDTFIFGTQEMGSGQVIYLSNNPLFRGFWYNGRLLFGNAVFLVGQQ
jgi:hypothetical protein